LVAAIIIAWSIHEKGPPTPTPSHAANPVAFSDHFVLHNTFEISQDQTIDVITEHIPYLESRYNVLISYPAVRTAVAYAEKYIQALPFPKKALDLLEETVIAITQTDEKVVLPRHIAHVLSDKTGMGIEFGLWQRQIEEVIKQLTASFPASDLIKNNRHVFTLLMACTPSISWEFMFTVHYRLSSLCLARRLAPRQMHHKHGG